MSENLPNIDDLFKKAIEQHEDAPSRNVWDAIDKNLDKKKVAFLSAKYNKLRWVAAALLLFSFGMAMYVWQTKMKNNELVNQNDINKPSKTNNLNSNKIDDTNFTNPQIASPADKETADNQTKNKQVDSLHAQIINGETKNEQKINLEKDIAQDQNRVSSPTIGKNLKPNEKNHVVKLEKEKNTVYVEKEKKENSTAITLDKDQAGNISKQETNAATEKNITIEKYTAPIPLISTPQFNNIFQIQSSNPFRYVPENVSIADNISIKNNNKKNSAAKKKNAITAKNSFFSATAFFSPEFVGSDVRDDHPRFREDNRNEIKNNERLKSSSTYGILLDKTFGNKWSVGTGLYILSRVTDIRPKFIYARPDQKGDVNFRLNCSAGAAYIPLKSGATPAQGDSTRILSAQNTLQYVSIPLSVKYKLGKGKLNITPGVGIAVNILSRGKVESVIATAVGSESNTSTNIEGLKSGFFNTQISLGLAYNLSNKIALNFTPTSRLALTSINKDAPVKTKLNSFGLAAGITVKF